MCLYCCVRIHSESKDWKFNHLVSTIDQILFCNKVHVNENTESLMISNKIRSLLGGSSEHGFREHRPCYIHGRTHVHISDVAKCGKVSWPTSQIKRYFYRNRPNCNSSIQIWAKWNIFNILIQFRVTSNSFIDFWGTSNSFIPFWVIYKCFIEMCIQLETFGKIRTASIIFSNRNSFIQTWVQLEPSGKLEEFHSDLHIL